MPKREVQRAAVEMADVHLTRTWERQRAVSSPGPSALALLLHAKRRRLARFQENHPKEEMRVRSGGCLVPSSALPPPKATLATAVVTTAAGFHHPGATSRSRPSVQAAVLTEAASRPQQGQGPAWGNLGQGGAACFSP